MRTADTVSASTSAADVASACPSTSGNVRRRESAADVSLSDKQRHQGSMGEAAKVLVGPPQASGPARRHLAVVLFAVPGRRLGNNLP